jgi:hypothetical protein
MTTPVETKGGIEGNFEFNDRLIITLIELTKGTQPLKVLDYGAGLTPHNITRYAYLQENQHTVAFEPRLTNPSIKKNGLVNGVVEWVNERPQPQHFDLVVYSFSLHHMNKAPYDIIRQDEIYDPTFVAIIENDVSNSTLDGFKKGFQAEAEREELQSMFGGDWQKCFDFHMRLGENDYREALERNGFTVFPTQRGEGVAANKFFMIGKAAGK